MAIAARCLQNALSSACGMKFSPRMQPGKIDAGRLSVGYTDYSLAVILQHGWPYSFG